MDRDSHRRVIFLLVGLAVIAVAACSTVNNEQADGYAETESDLAARARILAAPSRHIEAVKRRDVKAAAAVFTDDAVHVITGSSGLTPHRVEGRVAIDEMEADIVNIETIDAPHTLHSVRRAGDMALVIGSQAGTVKVKGQPLETFSASYIQAWRLEPDQTWRIHYMVVY